MNRTTRGFTLLETLVSLVVLSVGLLGAAALLLDNLRTHAGALRRVAALSLVRDMADRIRANPRGGVYYDTRMPAPAAAPCGGPGGCDVAQLAAADLAYFESTAHALFPRADTNTRVEYAPATGHATPARHIITLRWSDARNDAGTDSVALQVLTLSPVAG
ncbi:MAG TPA: type IV pilus modification protein PilV [Steroidobacteraceae bacterium]|nr:type IV pilus modification protein PilV [Steroidobacteraceae bacterium]